jgi:hypothetical protein
MNSCRTQVDYDERGFTYMNRTKAAIYAALAAVVLVPALAIHAQTRGGTVVAITKLENDGVKADLAGDSAWPEKYIADDWIGCDSGEDDCRRQE